mgnify:FL=1
MPFDEPLTQEGLLAHLKAKAWFLSVVTPPGQGPDVPIVMAPLCRPCAVAVMPELVKAVEEKL